MAKHKFKWYDGTELEFEDFESDKTGNNQIYMALPSGGKRNRGYAYLTMSPADKKDFEGGSQYTPNGYGVNKTRVIPDPKKIRVGILTTGSSAHNFPEGCYIPYVIVNQQAQHRLDDLDGEFIIHDKYLKQKV